MGRSKVHFTVTKMNGGSTLHIEAPGCIVNIHAGLHNTEGDDVTNVSIQCDQYAGETPWVPVEAGTDGKSASVRIVRKAQPEKTEGEE